MRRQSTGSSLAFPSEKYRRGENVLRPHPFRVNNRGNNFVHHLINSLVQSSQNQAGPRESTGNDIPEYNKSDVLFLLVFRNLNCREYVLHKLDTCYVESGDIQHNSAIYRCNFPSCLWIYLDIEMVGGEILGGRELISLVDVRNRSNVVVEVNPGMSPDELAERLRERGVIGRDEVVSFGFIDERGGFHPRAIGSVRDLIEAAKAGRIVAFQAERIYGLRFSDWMSELSRKYGFRYNSFLGGHTAQYLSKYDGSTYLIVIQHNTLTEPPIIHIFPYPQYVQRDQRFSKTHARSCLMKKRTKTGEEYGFLHIDEVKWAEIIGKVRNPVVLVLESLTQALGLYPTYH